MTAQELVTATELAVHDAALTETEGRFVERLLQLDELDVRGIMTPRTVVLAAAEEMTLQAFHDANPHLRFSRIPTYHQDEKDRVTGYFLKDALLASLEFPEGVGFVTGGEQEEIIDLLVDHISSIFRRLDREGKVVIAHTADPLSQLEVETGMMLGHFGRVTRILRLPANVQVETSGGTILTGPREGAITTAAVAPAATPSPDAAEPPQTAAALPAPKPRPEPAAQAAAEPAPVPQQPAPIPPKAAGAPAGVLIQAGSFTVGGNASAAARTLSDRGLAALVREPTSETAFFRLLVGQEQPDGGELKIGETRRADGQPDAKALEMVRLKRENRQLKDRLGDQACFSTAVNCCICTLLGYLLNN